MRKAPQGIHACLRAYHHVKSAELAVYAAEFDRTGFQGGFAVVSVHGRQVTAELETFSGRTLDVRSSVCTQMAGHLPRRGRRTTLGGGGAAEEVGTLLLKFVMDS
jgi:hypothetical protein